MNDEHPKLSRLRDEIDKIDKKIIEAIAERHQISAKIGKYKKAKKIPIKQKKREKEPIKKRIQKNKHKKAVHEKTVPNHFSRFSFGPKTPRKL